MTSRTPCLAGLRPLSCSCSLTIWVASENRLAKLRTPRTYCFNAGFSGLPNGVTPQPGSAASGTVHNTGDKQWSAKMKSIGLIPSHTGQVGGKKTGQKMTHYVQADGPYQVAYKDLQSTGFALKWQSPEEVKVKGKPKKQSSKTKFTCPKCQQNVWGCPEVRVACGVCYAASGDD